MFDRKANLQAARVAKRVKRESRISALDTFERLYRVYRNERLEVEALMRQDLGTGRPPVPRERGDETALVNGSEVRGSERWLRTRVLLGRDGKPFDMGCYLVRADGTREPFAVSREKTSKSRAVKVSASRADVDRALMSAMGTIHEPSA